MIRRILVLTLLAALIAAAMVVPTLPAGAAHPQAVDPAQLALPQSALPDGTGVDHAGVSDNADADGTTTPPDGFKSQLRIVHSKNYEDLGRITGYREDIHFTVQGVQIGSEYLASEFGSADQAKAAMDDATGPLSLISIIGKPLPDPCTAGESCRAFFGPVPGSTNNAVLAIFTRGPFMVETASQAPASSFAQLESTLEADLYRVLAGADGQIQDLLGLRPATKTPAPTDTPVPPTDTPVPPTATPKPASVSKKKPKCKKGYKLVHGKCTKVKKPKKGKKPYNG